MIPPAPEWLSDAGKAEWRDKVDLLHSIGMLEKSDLMLLAAYCNEVSIYMEAEQEMRSSGRFYTVKEGRKIKYAASMPAVRIAKEALEQIVKIGSEFGFSPASRMRITMPQKPKEESKVSKLLKGV